MIKPFLLAARVAALLCCLFSISAWSATVIVTSNADSGPNTLRNALANANAGDTITFALPGATITLASTLTVAKDVTIDGSGNTGLTVDGNASVQVFVVNAGVTAVIKNVTIANGNSADTGGIHNNGTLVVANCTLADNFGGSGGGIYNEGVLTLTNSTVTGNSTNHLAGLGGGVRVLSGTATFTNNTFVGNTANYGGGIFVDAGGAVTLSNNAFVANTANSFGGSVGASGVANANHNLYWNNADQSGTQGINCNGCASNTDVVNADPQILPLGDNGGPTQTYLPIGTPAVAAGNPAVCPITDQRGIPRPQSPGVCDIGSVTVSKLCYVKAGTGAGANSGASWTDAYLDLQTALNDTACAQVWVAKGTYRPTSGNDRSVSFAPRRGVTLFGGFAGTESRINPRSAANATTLSGDIGTSGDASDNSYHVVRLDGTTAAGTITADTNVIDGFTITGGNADGDVPGADSRGGGLYCAGAGSGHECSPWLNNLDIVGNSSADWAGGAYFDGEGGNSSPLLTNSTIRSNSAVFGGGVMCFGQAGGVSNPTIGNVTFAGNTAGLQGAALYNAAYDNGTSSPTLMNVTFSGNVANGAEGGAVLSDGRVGGISEPVLTNVILWGDSATADAEFHANTDSSAGSAHATIDSSVVQGGCPGNATCSGVITADPLLGALANHGGLTPTLVPDPAGSAVDSGDDTTCAAKPIDSLDQRGFVRPFLQHCDVGAVEFNDRVFASGFEAN